jgi:hypothetical protein
MFIAIFGLTFTPQKSNIFLLNLIGPDKKNWNYEGSQKLKILWKDGVPPPLAHRYMWEWEDFEQNLKQGAIGNTHEEHIGNLLEQRENEKKSSSFHPPPPKLKRKPMGNTLGTC